MRRTVQRYSAAGIGLFLAVGMSGPVCNESIAPYQDPRDVFAGVAECSYSLHAGDNSVNVDINVTNSFDETLEGSATLVGEAEIYLVSDPSLRKKFTLTSANLLTTRNYNAATGLLRVDAGETLRFRVKWNLVADNGVDLRTAIFSMWKDPECPGRCIAEEVSFLVSGTMEVFEKTGTVETGLSRFSLCYSDSFVSPQFCPPIDASVPCSRRAVTSGPLAKRCSTAEGT